MEPFGKDHGAAGGSYDTGKEISVVLGEQPPYPTTYEWISLKGVGAMSSSTGVTIGPLEALELVLEIEVPDYAKQTKSAHRF